MRVWTFKGGKSEVFTCEVVSRKLVRLSEDFFCVLYKEYINNENINIEGILKLVIKNININIITISGNNEIFSDGIFYTISNNKRLMTQDVININNSSMIKKFCIIYFYAKNKIEKMCDENGKIAEYIRHNIISNDPSLTHVINRINKLESERDSFKSFIQASITDVFNEIIKELKGMTDSEVDKLFNTEYSTQCINNYTDDPEYSTQCINNYTDEAEYSTQCINNYTDDPEYTTQCINNNGYLYYLLYTVLIIIIIIITVFIIHCINNNNYNIIYK
ncbi:uncharacterized protein NEPG_01862 [Nematocida parisii ERTm1]|nr:uncharacterized protein NEPG_01862 [Nematocida parisii ERTm1]EIJ93520.1 hypothetical protein NEPG_01862 [Nematocida parisii ERTm1]|eukprot:XP_013059690.1 hypothetical protein NEPG_01862 [Nematocida parisii ERTm1]